MPPDHRLASGAAPDACDASVAWIGIGENRDRRFVIAASLAKMASSTTEGPAGSGQASACRAWLGDVPPGQAAAGESAPATKPMASRRFEGLASLRILVAEDAALNLRLVKTLIEPLGCPVDGVADGAAAVEAVGTRDYALVLMDVSMPQMNGLEATRRIRALGGRFADLPIIAMTGHVYPGEILRCREAGMNDHIAKPFGSAALINVVLKWIRLPRQVPWPDTGREPEAGLGPEAEI